MYKPDFLLYCNLQDIFLIINSGNKQNKTNNTYTMLSNTVIVDAKQIATAC